MSHDLGKLNPKLRLIILITLLSLKQQVLFGQVDSASVISELSNGWMVTEDNNFRIIQSDKIKRNTIHFYLNEESRNSNLLIRIPGGSSIWLDNNLFEFYKNDTSLVFFTNLFLNGRKEILVSIYGKGLNRSTLETKLINTSFVQSRTPNARGRTGFKDFYLMSFFFGLVLTAFFKMSPSGNIQEYFMVGRTLFIRSRDEVIFKSKLLTAPNPVFYLVLSFLASQLGTVLIILSPASFNPIISNEGFGPGGLFFVQFIILVGFYIWILFKWIIVRYLGGLFRISEFSSIHFFNYQRLSLYGLLLITTCLFTVYFSMGSKLTNYSFFIWTVLLVAGFRIVLILLKLLNASSYKFLHLFSYLCATEIIPYLFAIKLILI